ncbi:hypothetical protein V8E55_000519 [Tylopilus felleus]
MHSKTILQVASIIVLAAFGHAEPIPILRRYDFGSAIDSWTAEAGSLYTKATSDAASWYSVGASAASAGLQDGLSDASTWLQSHGVGATNPGSAFPTVTPVAGAAESVLTYAGGPAITLAPSGQGVVTTYGGSQFTVIAPTSTANAATHVHAVTLKGSPVLAALLTVVGGTLLGAWLTC